MGLFKSKYEKELDALIAKMNMAMSNNYKDAAQMDLKEYEEKLEEFHSTGKLKEASYAVYTGQLSDYKERLKGYTHQDQKPYWT